MKNIIKTTILISSASFLVACGGFGDDDFSTDISDVSFSEGDVNLANYVALGDSLTAGFADGTLYRSGQQSSFPNILAQSFEQVGGGSFTQPLMNDNLGGLLFGTATNPDFDVRLVLFPDPTTGDLGPVRQNVVTPGAMPTSEATTSPIAGLYNNLGVPGAKSFHLLFPNYGNAAGLLAMPATANPFFVRFRSDAATTVVADAVAQSPTFFTLWIGNNDILGFGTTGGDGSDPITPVTDTDMNSATPDFTSAYNGIVATLTAGGTNDVQGVLINIPAITSIPFFTTVPFNAIPLDQATADTANAGYDATYNAVLNAAGVACSPALSADEVAQRRINFTAGQNAVVIEDESLTTTTCNVGGGPFALDKLRHATASDFILLTTLPLLGTERTPGNPATVIGVGSALTDSEALTETEAAEIETARQAYNQIILAAANANNNLIHIDAATLLADVADSDGLNYGSGNVTSVFATGGAFSLDGIHPTAKGYSIVANTVIDALNTNFNANLPRVNPNNFTEVFFAFPDGFDFSQ